MASSLVEIEELNPFLLLLFMTALHENAESVTLAVFQEKNKHSLMRLEMEQYFWIQFLIELKKG